MRPPTNAFEREVYDAYWAMNRAHKGLHDALTSISMGATWKDCQKAALLAEDKVNDAVIMVSMNRLATTPQNILPADRKEAIDLHDRGVWGRLRLHERGVWGRLRLHAKKAVNAPNPEKMKKALMEALRITMEIEEDILRFYEGLSKHAKHTTHAKQSKQSLRRRTLRKRTLRKTRSHRK
jgi:hypothetical protein